MGKSICRQNAAEYRLMAEIERCQRQRTQLLQFASEWEALAAAAAMRAKRRADYSARDSVAANHPEHAAA